jgi:hypothetical protein
MDGSVCPAKPFSCPDENVLKQTARYRQIEGAMVPMSVLNLIYGEFLKSAVLGMATQGGKTTMTEVVTSLLVFLSAGVFLAHACDAYRGHWWTES